MKILVTYDILLKKDTTLPESTAQQIAQALAGQIILYSKPIGQMKSAENPVGRAVPTSIEPQEDS